MDANKVYIDRNSSGIYATANVIINGQTQRVTIWAKPGHYANEYQGKSDDELKQIAADHYNETWTR